MKVLAIVGSRRVNGNTEMLARVVLGVIEEAGLETELLRLSGLEIAPCDGCLACSGAEACSIDDDLQPIYAKMKESEGIILASPVYFGSATALIKAVMERAGFIARNNGNTLAGKVGSPLVVGRRAGHNFAYTQLLMWYTILGMVVPGASYWPIAFGRNKGDVETDSEGLQTARSLGKNIADLVTRLGPP